MSASSALRERPRCTGPPYPRDSALNKEGNRGQGRDGTQSKPHGRLGKDQDSCPLGHRSSHATLSVTLQLGRAGQSPAQRGDSSWAGSWGCYATPGCPVCFLEQGLWEHLTSMWALGTLLSTPPSPRLGHKTSSTPPSHIAHTYAHTHVHMCLVALQGERAANRWDRLWGVEGEMVGGGVWKPIFLPQKPQSRRNKASNPQGPLGGAQRYTQLARSPPRESHSRWPVPQPLATVLPEAPVGLRMETIRRDFQAQRDRVPGPCCPQRGTWSSREGLSAGVSLDLALTLGSSHLSPLALRRAQWR